MSQPDWFTVGVAFVGGSTVAALVTHRLTLSKERRNRRNDFRSFLAAWLNGVKREPDVWKCYGPDNLEPFSRHRGMTANDFFWKRRFRSMCDELSGIEKNSIQADPERYRELIAQKIEKLIDFV